jgi:Tol biopolymer transport system component
MKSVVIEEKRPTLRFGGFTLDLDQHALFSGGERVRLTEKPLETLIFLVENRGRVVEKSEIFEAVWNGTYVTEDALVHAVREVRRALGDDKENPKFVQTVPRRGYRFIGEVLIEQVSNGDAVAAIDNIHEIQKRSASRENQRIAWPIGLAAIALILGVLVAGYFYVQKPSPLARTRYETQKQVTSGEFSAGKPAFSPDGKLILCVWSSPETRGFGDIFVISQDGRSIPITKHENPSGDMPVFTADSTSVVFARYRDGSAGDRLPDLKIVPASGVMDPRTYIPEASGAGFSPDGKYVAYTKHLPSQKALWLSASNDLEAHQEVAATGFTPRFSPDGKWLAYSSSDPEGGAGDLWVVDTTTLTDHRNLTKEPNDIYGLAWTADSSSIVFASKRSGTHMLWQTALSGGEPRPLMPTFGGYANAPAISPDGKTLIFQYGRIAKDLWLGKIGSQALEGLTTDEIHSRARFSPSATRLASFVQRHDFGRDLSIIDLGATGAAEKRVDLADTDPESLCWIDETRVGYLAADPERGLTKVIVVNTGNGIRTTLTEFEGSARDLAVSLGGRYVAVVINDAENLQGIVVRDLETQTDRVISSGGVFTGLRWREDGSGLYWSGPDRSANSQTGGIWFWDAKTTSTTRVAYDGFGPIWSRDNSTLYYAKGRGMYGLWQRREGEAKVLAWPDNVNSFDVADQKVVFIQAKEIVRAQIYSVELEN